VSEMDQTFWRHNKTGNRYFVYKVVQTCRGPLVLYQEPGAGVSYDYAKHTETGEIWLIGQTTPGLEPRLIKPLHVGSNAKLTVEGKHLWARPLAMWRDIIQVDGPDGAQFLPRFEQLT
jgi:hypothetical protein